jgi:hypothetical protein
MTSEVGICNLALAKLGAQSIVSLLDDTRNARAMNRLYDDKRDLEVSSHPWTFAMTRASIPASTSVPAFGWSRAFPRPVGCLRVVQVGEIWALYDGAEGAAFQLEGASILTNESSPLALRYLQRITNTGQMTPLFIEVLACRLAFEACKEITGSSDLRQSLWAERDSALREARRINAIEKPPERPIWGSWRQALRGAT